MSDEIPTVEAYRGVGIDNCQPRDRIETVVKPAIDEVFAMTSTDGLLLYCNDISKPPEARALAAAKLEAEFEVAAADRIARPDVDVGRVRAAVAGLGSRKWRSPSGYGALIDVPPAPGQTGHDFRPPEYQRQVEEDRSRQAEEERAERPRSQPSAAAD